MEKRFVSEVLYPLLDGTDPARAPVGGPLLPMAFRWQNREVRVLRMVRTWRETGKCHHGSGEAYVRKHWYELTMEGGENWKVYCERQARPGKAKARWWLYTAARLETAH